MPPAGVVAAPLRRLFVLQFGVLVGGLIVYWPLDSSRGALIVLILLVAAAEVALAVLERLRTARIRAAAGPLAGFGAPGFGLSLYLISNSHLDASFKFGICRESPRDSLGELLPAISSPGGHFL